MATRNSKYHGYVQGSNARKLETIPEQRPYHQREIKRKENPKKQAKVQPKQRIDLFSMLFIAAAVMVTLYTCVSYIQIQHNIMMMSKQAATMESEISDLKNQNDVAYNKINTSVDLAYVYDVAVNELGMVRADQAQIFEYDNIKSDFVRQYAPIPEIQKSALERAITKKN